MEVGLGICGLVVVLVIFLEIDYDYDCSNWLNVNLLVVGSWGFGFDFMRVFDEVINFDRYYVSQYYFWLDDC